MMANKVSGIGCGWKPWGSHKTQVDSVLTDRTVPGVDTGFRRGYFLFSVSALEDRRTGCHINEK